MRLILLGVETELADALAKAAQTVDTRSAHEAITALATFEADATLIDYTGAGTQAPALVSMLRNPKRTPRPNMPIIALLDVSSPAEVQRLVRSGINYLMVKPISVSSLLQLADQAAAELMAQISTQTYIGPDRRRVDPGQFGGKLDRRNT